MYKGEKMSSINAITKLEQTNNSYNVNSSKKSTNASFSSFLGETKSLDEIFDKAAEKYNVPVNLLKAIGKAESNFDENAVSRCGAQGIMQLMPATAESLGVTDSLDAEQNIMGGAKYISGLLKKYDGNITLALAAYNAGSGNVAKYGGVPPFKETQNYVKKVTNYMNEDINIDKTVTVGNTANNTVIKYNQTATYLPIIKSSAPTYQIIENTNNNLDQDLDSLFSYDDYLLFLEKFMEDDNDKKSDADSNYLASNTINYNLPVINLLKM